jgi:hypothetical protein
MKQLLLVAVLALVCAAAAQAQPPAITAATPGLQIVQLRSQISRDMYALSHQYRVKVKVHFGTWYQLVRTVIAHQETIYHRKHFAWATRQLKRRWSLLGDVRAWTCIHRGEGSWTDSGSPYYGGLQMDLNFQRTYGGDMLKKYGGTAERWHPYDQMIVAERARRSGRGYYPWPNTARACGLI